VDGWWDPATKTDSIPSDFAAIQVRLDNAMTPCPQVRPAVCSILTGKSPLESGVRDDVSTPLRANVPLITEKLREGGWRTAAFIADPRVGQGSGLERGFEIFDPPRESLLGPYRRLPRVRNPGDVVADFSSWIATVPDEASFLAWIHLTRPMIDPPSAGAAENVGAALGQLSQLLNGSARMKGASVMLLGTAGRVDLDDGAKSGYFLAPDVLRVPVLLRSGAKGGANLDPQAPFRFVDVAGWISHQAGIDAAAFGAADGAAPRVAWTWRGRTEFGWPAEVAAQKGSAICVRGLPDSDDGCAPWERERAVDDADRRACLEALSEQARLGAALSTIATLPVDLAERVKNLGLPVPAANGGAGSAVPRDTRARAVPSITQARRFADKRKADDADNSYQQALAIDPKNLGALIEAGEALALAGRPKLAKARLEPAFRSAPWNPEVWHWMGHVSYLEKQLDRAEVQWRVSDTLEPNNGDVLYDLACARSLAGDTKGSEAYLRLAWQAGFKDVNAIQVDSDLRNLRADPAYVRFMREVGH
jgi:tetratricopeptide (TPR) repeat protein